ncbi:hypothetical protein B0A52_02454 [Exophiala mesophila]|uniref:Zn(2)-C6 fungal-type domain-containing protein n=1 Tax=Exophiala mesophila TaxID=212818 RepID=A0A438ND19_EXOME|nr:hypothetical protein B0A52_02454 [Exophiala mesophila]
MRGGIKRTRTGCARCKERKLKCDETRPGCIRCDKRNSVCPGYGANSLNNEILNYDDFNLLGRGSTEASTSFSEATGSGPCANAGFGKMSPLSPTPSFDDYNASDIITSADRALFAFMTLSPLQEDSSNSWPATSYPHLLSEPLPTTRNDSISHYSPELATSNPEQSLVTYQPGSRGDATFEGVSSPSRKENDEQQRNVHNTPQVCTRITNNYSSMLAEFYFKEVAGLFSCYDSQLNPFRTTVSKLWQSSTPVFYVVQSMAAACLSDVFPKLHATGALMRDRAAACVEADIRDSKIDTGTLLTLIMLGLSASWHRAGDLGQEEFKHAHTILAEIKSGKNASILEHSNTRNLQFFQEAMIYWEMLLSYVSDVSTEPPPSTDPVHGPAPPSRTESNDPSEPNFPHPWTGVAREVQTLVFEVGRLVRRERHRIRNRPYFTSLADINNGRKAVETAQALADRLWNLILPTEETVISPGDAQTPVQHLLTIAEAYRLAGLLQLYRVFPDLLAGHKEDLEQDKGESQSAWNISEEFIHKNFTSIALEIVDLLRTIPTESRTRCVQPFLLVAAAGELRAVSCSQVATPTTSSGGHGDKPDEIISAIRVFEARKFITRRLSTFEHVLPAKPIRQMMEIVNHTWSQLDVGLANVYWMDVMIEKGWETTMG